MIESCQWRTNMLVYFSLWYREAWAMKDWEMRSLLVEKEDVQCEWHCLIIHANNWSTEWCSIDKADQSVRLLETWNKEPMFNALVYIFKQHKWKSVVKIIPYRIWMGWDQKEKTKSISLGILKSSAFFTVFSSKEALGYFAEDMKLLDELLSHLF